MGTVQPLDHEAAVDGQLLNLYLAEALRGKAQGCDARAYHRVVDEVNSLKRCARCLGEDQAAHLSSLLTSFASCVSLLNQQSHQLLLSEVLSIPVWGPPEDVRNALLGLLGHLVAHSSSLTHQCLQKLIVALLPPPFLTVDHDPEWLEADVEAAQLQNDVIASLEQILALVPTASSQLVSLASSSLPHVLRDRATHVLYVRALLRLALRAAVPAARAGLLTVVVEHLVSLDCEIRWQDIAAHAEPEEEAAAEEDEDIFELEGQTEHMHVTQPGVAAEAVETARGEGARGGFEGAVAPSRDGAATASTSGPSVADLFAGKLDSLMEAALAHLEAAMDQGQGPTLWPAMLLVFQRAMLRAYRCKFAQYLLWYMCLREPLTAPASFVAHLLALITNPATMDSMRSSAAAYLSSFLARAGFVPAHVTADSLHQLATWCLAYCAARPSRPAAVGLGTPDSRRISLTASAEAASHELSLRHQVFYAACQGLFYVMCFRLEDLMLPRSWPPAASSPGSPRASDPVHVRTLRQLFSSVIPQLLDHWLAPLAVCAPPVAMEFTALAQRLNLLPAPANAAWLTAAATNAQRPMEMFFPFDPYLLRRSAARLQLRTSYLAWGHGRARVQAHVPNHGQLDPAADSCAASLSDQDQSHSSGASSTEQETESVSDVQDSGQLSDFEHQEPDEGSYDSRRPLDHQLHARQQPERSKAAALPVPLKSGTALSPHTPASQGPSRAAWGAEAAVETSPASSPEGASGGGPMSWTPHIPLRKLQQAV